MNTQQKKFQSSMPCSYCMHNTAEHDAAPPAPPIPPSAARKAKADRPSIDIGVTTERWVYFQKRWNTYKISTGIAGADIQGQLMDTCSEQLRYVMFQDNNDIEQQPELHILESIRRLAGRQSRKRDGIEGRAQQPAATSR